MRYRYRETPDSKTVSKNIPEGCILCPWSFSSGEHAYYLPATPENVSYVKKQEELNDFSQKEFNYR